MQWSWYFWLVGRHHRQAAREKAGDRFQTAKEVAELLGHLTDMQAGRAERAAQAAGCDGGMTIAGALPAGTETLRMSEYRRDSSARRSRRSGVRTTMRPEDYETLKLSRLPEVERIPTRPDESAEFVADTVCTPFT